ncbi:MAG: Asp-tRNA(Asn)/Glu-tRNA(Gln) amidotransferase subunit GatC [Spartobacteria bacterium]|nr:Asp-tRNA(Asn)/Glu-tRNA(Gln) amidotransferase subunit GatC [Spartobacteria bacterium]
MAKYTESTEHIDVSYVAHLARLKLTPEETVLYQSQLEQILDYVKELQELDVREVPPMAHPRPVNNVFRADEGAPSLPHERVMDNAPAQRDDQFLVPKIVE